MWGGNWHGTKNETKFVSKTKTKPSAESLFKDSWKGELRIYSTTSRKKNHRWISHHPVSFSFVSHYTTTNELCLLEGKSGELQFNFLKSHFLNKLEEKKNYTKHKSSREVIVVDVPFLTLHSTNHRRQTHNREPRGLSSRETDVMHFNCN